MQAAPEDNFAKLWSQQRITTPKEGKAVFAIRVQSAAGGFVRLMGKWPDGTVLHGSPMRFDAPQEPSP